MVKLKCAECGRPIEHAYYINGKAYGYNCYKQKLAIIYKQWEDEKNAEHSVKCFAAMQIFQGKRSNSFHDSVCNQWNKCKKLTAKQLECIIKGFSAKEKIDFWVIWQSLTNDNHLKEGIASWVENLLYEIRHKNPSYFTSCLDNEAIINCLLHNRVYRKYGFHLWRDIEDYPEIVCMSDNRSLQENLEDEYIEVLKVVKSNS